MCCYEYCASDYSPARAMPVLTEELLRLKGHRWQVSCLAFSPDGLRFASGGWDKEVHVRNLAAPDTKCILKGAHKAPITSVCWQKPQGGIVCSGSADRTAALWNLSNESVVARLQGHDGWVLGTSFSNALPCVATASWDQMVRLWSLESQSVIATLTGHTKGVWGVDFHPRSAELCSAGDEGNVIVWDARSSKPVANLSGGHSGGIYSAVWSQDGSLIASGSSDTKVCIWELRSRSVLKTVLGHADTVKSIAFNPQMRNVAIPVLASAGGCSIRLSDVRPSHKTDIITLTPHATGKEVESVAISPDGTLLASGGRDGLIVLHNLFVPSVLPRSESYRSSSAFVRTSRLFSNRSSHLEDNEDENEIEKEVTALDNILADSLEPKEYTKLKRLSRAEEKDVEVFEPAEKRVGSSAKKSRSERAKEKPADIANTVSHLQYQDPKLSGQPLPLLASETIASKVVAFSSSAVSKSVKTSHDEKAMYTEPVDLSKLKKQFEQDLDSVQDDLAPSISQVLSSASITHVASSIIEDESENENENDGLTEI